MIGIIKIGGYQMKNKYILGVLVLTMILSFALVGCGSNKDAETEPEEVIVEDTDFENITINIGSLAGPTGMGMVRLMEMVENNEASFDYNIEIAGSPDDLVGKIISGEVQIASVPTNMALLLHNRTEGQVQLAAVNTLGVLYVLENGDTVNEITDLKGKTLNTSGKGASPDFIIQYLLKENGLSLGEDLFLDYSLQHGDLAAALVEGDVDLALLPQPHVTSALMRNENLRIALDITEEWEKTLGDSSELAMGVLIVQKSFVEENKEAFNRFLEEYEESINFTNENIDEAAELIAKYGILPNANIAKKAIPLSNIVYKDAVEARIFLDEFFNILYEFEPSSIGGKLADEGFYYQK